MRNLRNSVKVFNLKKGTFVSFLIFTINLSLFPGPSTIFLTRRNSICSSSALLKNYVIGNLHVTCTILRTLSNILGTKFASLSNCVMVGEKYRRGLSVQKFKRSFYSLVPFLSLMQQSKYSFLS